MIFYATSKDGNIIKNIKKIEFIDGKVIVNDVIEVIDIRQVFSKDELVTHRKTVPPRIERVKSYCNMRKNNIDPQSFMDYYDSIGWYIGKKKMKDWQGAIRTREANNKGNNRQQETQTKSSGESWDQSKILERLNG